MNRAGPPDQPAGASQLTGAGQPGRADPPARVSTLELFFDLVFVFTITQLTSVLASTITVIVTLRVMLMLALIMWMYGGYAWLNLLLMAMLYREDRAAGRSWRGPNGPRAGAASRLRHRN